MSRKDLPFREKTEVFLYDNKKNIVAENHGHYIMFPGGGIDKGENMKTSASREIKEETGAIV
jgi:8-oxo-dGTP pyrophosphatase MutT (NUDIX family)